MRFANDVHIDNADICPPGLTCANCGQPFHGAIARRTQEGFSHVECPTTKLRQCDIEGCTRRQFARPWCRAHYDSARHNNGDPLARERAFFDLEDAAWLAEHGEIWEQAARRLGVKPGSLRTRLIRSGRTDLIERLDHNSGQVAS